MRIKLKERVISFIGMSGSGKTYWSKKLADEAQFTCYSCDDLIAVELDDVLTSTSSVETERLSRWLGFPFEPQFAANEKIYLDYEARVVRECIEKIRESKDEERIVCDTTGSFIYLPTELQDELQSVSTIVCLETPPEAVNVLYKRYMNNPKPIVWNGNYRPASDERPEEALHRCYYDLLHERLALYSKRAEVKLPFDRCHNTAMSAQQFLTFVQERARGIL